LSEAEKLKVENRKEKSEIVEQENRIESAKKKLSYMEKRELDELTKEIAKLEKERDDINRIFDRKDIPYDDIRLLSEEL